MLERHPLVGKRNKNLLLFQCCKGKIKQKENIKQFQDFVLFGSDLGMTSSHLNVRYSLSVVYTLGYAWVLYAVILRG